MRPMSDGPTVLILSAAMGGGHLQISHEIRRRMMRSGWQAEVVDVLDCMPGPTGRLLGGIYPLLVNRSPRLYSLVYEMFFRRGGTGGSRVGTPVHLMLPALRRIVDRRRPDLVLSTYPLCSVALGRMRADGDLACPAVTVVTTFSLNRLWLHPGVDAMMCISQEAARDAAGRSDARVAVSGPIVRPEFDGCRAGSEGRTGPRRALITTGSLGLAGDARLAARTVARLPGWQAVVLCGRDEDLKRRMAREHGVEALGWTDDMPAVMGSVDVLVDNAAGMTSKEALVAGLPVVTFRPLPGHGRDDARAMARLGVTEVVETPDGLATTLDRLTSKDVVRGERIRRGRGLCVERPLAMLDELGSLPRTAATAWGLVGRRPGTAARTTDDGASV